MTSIELREIAALRAGLEPPGQLDIVQLGRRPTFTEDEYQLGTLGYRQNFLRGLGLFENLAATFTTMNYVSAMPSLFVFAMVTGGPAAALVNWIVVGVLAFITSLAMAEIAAVYPTAGGIYYWSNKLGGPKYGPFLSWMTAWYNWLGWITIVPAAGQAATNFLISALQLANPHSAVLNETKSPWLPWLLTSIAITLLSFVPNVRSQFAMRWMIRLTVGSFAILFIIFTLALPIHVALSKDLKFQDRSIVNNFHYGVNTQGTLQASAAYCWIVGWLFPAWEFYGYDASVHISEETKKASKTVAWAILSGLLLTLFLSVPTLVSLIFCIQDFEAMLKAGFVNNFAEYLRQIVGKEVAFVILIICWFDSMLATTVSFMSAQRVTFALARDRILPCSEWIGKLTPNKMPRNAGIVVLGFAIFIEACILASVVAFTALTATATISTNLSYFFPIVCRLWGKWWKHANKWYLGPISRPIAVIAAIYIAFLFVVLMLPTEFPIKAENFNYAPIMIILLTITAIATWFWPKYGAVHWYNGPRRYISEEEVGNARIVQDPGRPQRPRDSYIRWLNGEGITSPGWPEAVGSERTQAR